jgi:hypothetical protein
MVLCLYKLKTLPMGVFFGECIEWSAYLRWAITSEDNTSSKLTKAVSLKSGDHNN